MCFSAPASFIASGGLTFLGVGATKKARTFGDKVLVYIPFGFAIQQFFEGVQWLSVSVGQPSLPLAYAFLFFAFLVWPTYVPLAVLVNEKKPRPILKVFASLGMATSLYLAFILATHELAVTLVGHSIKYLITIPLFAIVGAGYFLSVCGSFFASRNIRARWFGVAVTLSGLIAWIFYQATFYSVWCFFAALLSGLVFWHLHTKKK